MFKTRQLLWVLSVLLLVGLYPLGVGFFRNDSGEIEGGAKASEPRLSLEERFPYAFARGATLSSELTQLGVEFASVLQIVKAAEPYRNLARIPSGIRYQVNFNEADQERELSSLEFRFSPTEILRVLKTEGEWAAELVTLPVETKVITFSGLVTSSLWESAAKAKMDPNLITDLAEIFAWQVDFAREVRTGDRWRISVEQKLVDEELVGWGEILAADYENEGHLYEAILFRHDGESMGYFTPDGASMRRMFLKSPLKFGRISSRFQRQRFHPILKIHRPHLGVDYAAPTGTPIRAVGDGTISHKGWSQGGGNNLKIRHNSVYTTAYKHLHGFAPGVARGSKVKQGQVIGYVGATGLATGPHLHFEFFKSGRYVDPLSQVFPSADPVPPSLLEEFRLQAALRRGDLPQWGEMELASSAPLGSESEN